MIQLKRFNIRAVIFSTLMLFNLPAFALSTNPVIFSDCVGNAIDCCNPICKPVISACCFQNSCGLPVKTTITGKAGFNGLQIQCSAVSTTLMEGENPMAGKDLKRPSLPKVPADAPKTVKPPKK